MWTLLGRSPCHERYAKHHIIYILKSLLTQFYWLNFPYAWMWKETEGQCRASDYHCWLCELQSEAFLCCLSQYQTKEWCLTWKHGAAIWKTHHCQNCECELYHSLALVHRDSISFFLIWEQWCNLSFINCCSIFRRKKVAVTMKDSYYFFLCKFWSKFMRASNIIHNINYLWFVLTVHQKCLPISRLSCSGPLMINVSLVRSICLSICLIEPSLYMSVLKIMSPLLGMLSNILCAMRKVAGDVWHNMEESIVILYDQSAV